MCVMMLKSDMCRFMLLEKILNLLNLFAPTSFLKNLKFQHSPVGPPFRAFLCHLLSFAVQATSLALCACFHGSTFSLPCRVRHDRQVAVANEAPVDSARSIFTLRTTTTTTTTTTLITATTTTTIVVTLIVFIYYYRYDYYCCTTTTTFFISAFSIMLTLAVRLDCCYRSVISTVARRVHVWGFSPCSYAYSCYPYYHNCYYDFALISLWKIFGHFIDPLRLFGVCRAIHFFGSLVLGC